MQPLPLRLLSKKLKESGCTDATNELTSRALSVGLKGKVLDVVVDWSTPQQIYAGDKHQLFVPIWTSSGGKLLGGEAAITKAIAEYHRLVKK